MRADISLLFNFFVTGQRIRRLLGEAMAPSGMKPDEYAVYSLLFEMAPLTATQMSAFLGMPLSTVLDYLKTMDAAGHLERVPHPSDARAVQLRLSTRGLAAHERAHRYFVFAYNRFMGALRLPVDRVRIAIAAMDDAAQDVAAARRQPARSESRRSGRSGRARRTPAGRARGAAHR